MLPWPWSGVQRFSCWSCLGFAVWGFHRKIVWIQKNLAMKLTVRMLHYYLWRSCCVVNLYIFIWYIYMNTYLCIYMYIYIYIYKNVYVYIHIYVYIYIYICIHIYIQILVFGWGCKAPSRAQPWCPSMHGFKAPQRHTYALCVRFQSVSPPPKAYTYVYMVSG